MITQKSGICNGACGLFAPLSLGIRGSLLFSIHSFDTSAIVFCCKISQFEFNHWSPIIHWFLLAHANRWTNEIVVIHEGHCILNSGDRYGTWESYWTSGTLWYHANSYGNRNCFFRFLPTFPSTTVIRKISQPKAIPKRVPIFTVNIIKVE